MEYRKLGRSGLKVSIVGLGCNDFGGRWDLAHSREVIAHALDAGVNLFDTSDVYPSPAGGEGPPGRSEKYVGEALRGRRHEAIIATKFSRPTGEGAEVYRASVLERAGHAAEGAPAANAAPRQLRQGASRRHIIHALEGSLRRLGTDYIDLYQLHGPDPTTPLDETLRALDDLVRDGKVRYVGCSNFEGWRVAEAAGSADAANLTPFISTQAEYHMLDRRIEADLVPACLAAGVSVLPYFPLASGFLTGKYRRGEAAPEGTRFEMSPHLPSRFVSDAAWDRLERLEAFASARGHTLVDLAIGWLASQPHIGSIIAGASRGEQIAQNVAASDWRLDAAELAEIDEITLG